MEFSTFFEIVKFVVPSAFVFLMAYVMMRTYLDNQLEMRRADSNAALEMKQTEILMEEKKILLTTSKDAIPVKLQAYERLVLLLERNHPFKLIPTLLNQELTAPELQLIFINSVRTELDHNLTQQLYVSDDAWLVIRSAIEELINTVNVLAKTLPSEATGKDLSKVVLNYFMENKSAIPNESAILFLKAEARQMLGQ